MPLIRPIFLLVAALCPWLHAADLDVNFPNAADVPVTAESYMADGKTIAITLSHTPPPGAELMVIRNTSADFISGEFSNLRQGQRLVLTFAGGSFPFVANYHGGTGNDLTLQWADNRLVSWGYNGDGQLGQETLQESEAPIPGSAASSVLYGKTVTALYAGSYTSAAATSDGSLFAWGRGDLVGRTGTGGGSVKALPAPVDTSGVLAGKKVIAISGGFSHVAVLATDGTVASWGTNAHGQIGNNTTNSDSSYRETVPVRLTESPAIAGKRIVAISSGTFHTMALCSDGTVVGWGRNEFGSLGNGSNSSSPVPVAVTRSGVLAGKTVIAISTGRDHTLALCSDDTLVAWGMNGAGQLGNNSTVTSNVPVLVQRSGALAGKTINAVAAGGYHSMALCSDGTVVTWGDNSSGALGNNSTATSSLVPIAVTRTGALAGRVVSSIAAGQYQSTATCSDGTITAWGSGLLGNSSAANPSRVPVIVNNSTLVSGERYIRNFSGSLSAHNLALVATNPPPAATPLPAGPVADQAATLNGVIAANGTTLSVSFEYGTTTAYGSTIAATPATVSGAGSTPISRRITGLEPGTIYHYRIVATGTRGTLRSADMTFTTTMASALSDLRLEEAEISPTFAPNTLSYDATVPVDIARVGLRFVPQKTGAMVTVNGIAEDSAPVSVELVRGMNRILVQVTSPDLNSTRTYILSVVRVPKEGRFTLPSDVPITARTFVATGPAPYIILDFAPLPGARLTLVNHTGSDPIRGEFDNVVHGSIVPITRENITYNFIANYRGGDGNDLVLQWANTRLVGWGTNDKGQVGSGTTARITLPVVVPVTATLAGKSLFKVVSTSTSGSSLAFDKSLATWGGTSPTLPGPGPSGGLLAGKSIIQMTAGVDFNVVLFSDGTLASWGKNEYGQLGNGTLQASATPAAVDMTGVLAGKQVIAISTGIYHTLALCSDGSLAAWGYNAEGQTGDGSRGNLKRSPVLVNRSTALAGKRVASLTAGGHHSLAQCSDGTLVGWGRNDYAQIGLGAGGASEYSTPQQIPFSGVLAGKTVVRIAAGGSHTLVLCSDGSIKGWGYNRSGSVGVNHTSDVFTPANVVMTGALAGKTVIEIAAGGVHSYALCSDGTLVSWGGNESGQLGLGDTLDRLVPTKVSSTENFSSIFSTTASATLHGLLAIPLPAAATITAGSITATTAIPSGTASGNGSPASISFEYGATTDYGSIVPATTPEAGPTGTSSFSANLISLTPGTVYHFRIRATSSSGVFTGADRTFRTLSNNARLASLMVEGSTLEPAFDPAVTEYSALMAYGAIRQTITATAEDSAAKIRIGGVGGNSTTLTPAVGTTRIPLEVTAEDGTIRTYQLTLTRLPDVFGWDAATDIPARVSSLVLPSLPVNFSLRFPPSPGTNLTVINNTGLPFIQGTFSNLTQGQIVELNHGGRSYRFVADYFGGTGNDLVLRWAESAAFAWGANSYGQLGCNTQQASSRVPLPVDEQGILSGKVVTALSSGYLHSVALCADGTLASWGYNLHGQLGNGGTASSDVPVLVDRSGVLSGKTVVAVTSGPYHNLALCSDGSVVAWGSNLHGQLGNGNTNSSTVPVAVTKSGALAGKSVVALAAGHYQSFALCSDGTVAAWGYNEEGELGDGTTTSSLIPVTAGGDLTGRTVTSLSAGSYHTLAYCSDATVVSWGYNRHGQLGNGTLIDSPTPKVLANSGALAGKSIVALRAGADHSLSLCNDGTLVSWGRNHHGQLGDGTTVSHSQPVAVDVSGVLAGKSIVALGTGSDFSQALTSDGTLTAWGNNRDGSLGHGGTEKSSWVPVTVGPYPASVPVMALPTGSTAANGASLAALATARSTRSTPPVLTLQSWRELHFGENSRGEDAGDHADPDHDGVANLVEYAFGLDPRRSDADQLPAMKPFAGFLAIQFTPPAGLQPLIRGASVTSDFRKWEPIPNTGVPPLQEFRLPTDRPSAFMRLEVSQPSH